MDDLDRFIAEESARDPKFAVAYAKATHQTTIVKLPLYDEHGAMNPNYRLICTCGYVSNIASTHDEFPQRCADDHVKAHVRFAADPFENL